jgi:ribosomal protein S18 acetylase RimI-like enzyme
MPPIVVESLDHRERAVAERIHAIQIAAYSQEAKLLGVPSFPPLRRTLADIEGSDQRFFGAYLGATLVGVIALGGDPSGAAWDISSLVVLPECQRSGIARSLLASVVNQFPSRVLTVSTGVLNAPALALYAQFGFLESGRHLAGSEAIPVVDLCRPGGQR